MSLDFQLQQIQADRLQIERLDRAMRAEQLCLARQTRPSLAMQIRVAIGDMLVSIGERLSRSPETRSTPQTA